MWLYYSVACAIFYGIEGFFLKVLHKKNIDEFIVVKSLFLYSIPFLFPFALKDGFYFKDLSFFIFLFIVGIGNAFGFYFYSKAIKNTEVSIAVPILSLSPVLVIPSSYIIMGEILPLKGILGVFVTTIGLIILSYSKDKDPDFKKFISDKGVRYALITLLIWSIVASLDKKTLKLSSPLSYPFFAVTMITIFLFLSKLNRPDGASSYRSIFDKKYLLLFFVAGIIHSGLFLSHMLALNSSYVSYLIAIKRSGMLLTIILGYIVFKEKKPGLKLISAIIILFGIYLLIK